MFKILITDALAEEGLDLLRRAQDVEFRHWSRFSKQELLTAIQRYEALIVRSGTTVGRDVIESAGRLKVIGRAGVGVDNIDIEAATEHGVLVMNAPDSIAIATAEHTMALILAASRQLIPAHSSLLDGEWSRSSFRGQQLHGKRLGIIGLGRIGRSVAERAIAFGMQVTAYDPFVSSREAGDIGVQKQELNLLLSQSDYISVHAAKTSQTMNIIDRRAFDMMKQGVIVVNAARGALVDESALIEALNSGKVKAAALDVYAIEPPTGNPLIGMPNVIHTPHLGASTLEAQRNVAVEIVTQVLDALRGDAYRNVINSEAMPSYVHPNKDNSSFQS